VEQPTGGGAGRGTAGADSPPHSPNGGYPFAEATRQQVRLAIKGMTCGACAAKIERNLNQLEQVEARVNYAAERATVSLPAGLPVRRLIEQVESAGYRAELVDSGRTESQDPADDERRVRYLGRRLLVAALLFMPLGEWSTAFSILPWLRFPGWQWLFIGLGAPVVVWAAWPFHRAALRALRHRSATMDTLVSMGISAATVWSIYAMFFRDFSEPGRSGLYVLLHQGGGALYLDVAAGVTTFLLAGRFFEALARKRASDALRALAAVGATEVSIILPDQTEQRQPVSHLRTGTRFVVRAGEIIAADGRVTLGRAVVDGSAMTGESLPVDVTTDGLVVGGTVVLSGRIIVAATHVGEDTQLAQMLELVDQAQTQRASIQRLADRISAVFVPSVIGLAALTFTAWMVLVKSPESAFSAGLAVLIIACPCALGLATPAALRVASGRGAQLGIFFKGHQGLETSRVIDTVVLDKTGTVTLGRMELAELLTIAGEPHATLLHDLGALEQASEHPVAVAVTAAARLEFPDLQQPTEFRSLAGLGASGAVGGHQLVVGRAALLREHQVSIPAELSAACRRWEVMSRTAVLVARDGRAVGAAAVTDTVKESASPSIRELRRLGLRCILLTGDNESTARAVAAQVGIEEVVAGALPTQKVRFIQELQAQGHSVAMVGDGVNDAPALVVADLGLAIGSGTDVAIKAADLILVRDDLTIVPDAIRLARRTVRTIRGNLAWAFGYNVVAIPLAALGRLDPLIAGAAMALSSAFVVWNSSRLRSFRGSSTPRLALAPAPSVPSSSQLRPDFAGAPPGVPSR